MEVVLYFVHGPRPFFWKGQGPGIPPLGLPVQAFPLEKETSGRNADEFEIFLIRPRKRIPGSVSCSQKPKEKGPREKTKKFFRRPRFQKNPSVIYPQRNKTHNQT